MSKLTAEQIEASAWAATLVHSPVDKVPAGWCTVSELAAKLGKGTGTTGTQMRRAVREGRAEMQRFRILTSRGSYPVPHYRRK